MIIYSNLESYLQNNNILKKVWIIDSNIFKLWNQRILPIINNDNYFILESNEDNKNLETYQQILDFLFKNNIDRGYTIFGIGGGIVGDITGFIASTYLRGIKLIHVPTTLLSMVDSSIGGKTGVNTIYGKNMIGSIYQAKDIVIDSEWLNTLPEEHKTNGMAEVIKMAIIKGGKLYDMLWQSSPNLTEIIQLSANYKLEIIENDFRDTDGSRELLNLGHTWGHGYELSQNILHGFAVADGIVEELKYSHYYYKFPSLGVIKEIIDLLKKWKLLKKEKNLSFNRFDKNYETKLIYFYMSKDKKENRLVTVKDIGKPEIVTWNIDNWKFINSKYFRIKNNLIIKDKQLFRFNVPSSKSITNRSLICSVIASNFDNKEKKIENILRSEDTELMISALRQSNVEMLEISDNIIISPSKFYPKGNYYLGNSGTSVRFLLPLLAVTTNEEIIIDGSEDMRKRPIGPLVKSLIKFGCNIENKDYLPLKIKPANLSKLEITIDGTLSSQYVTGLILAFSMLKSINPLKTYQIFIEGEETSCGFIKMTLDMLKDFGINILKNQKTLSIISIKSCPSIYSIEGDATTASYLFAWSFINKFELEIPNLGINSVQSDTKVLFSMLKHFGKLKNEGFGLIFEPYDKIVNVLHGAIFDLDSSDTFLTWACLFYLEGKNITIDNIKNQNWKECARIDKFISNISRIGGTCQKTETGFSIKEIKFNKKNISIETEKDHRLAMSFSLLSMKHKNIYIENPHCVNKTYPNYWEDLKKIGIKIIPTDKIFTKTIALIGMPGTGKTTLAQEAGTQLNIKYFDIDKLISLEFDSIHNLIENIGWKGFRDLESKQIFESILDNNFKIISTGGGCIENFKSRNLLDNCLVIWIKRDIDKNEVNKRKLQDSYQNLKIKRENIYQNMSDYIYYNNKSPYDFVTWLKVILFQNPIPTSSNFLCKSEGNYESNISNCIEFRADLNNDLSKIQDLMINFRKPCIFTLRSKQEGGKFDGNHQQYLNLSKEAIKLGAKLIDIEVSKEVNLIEDNIITIGSIHSNDESYISNNLKKFNEDVLKIVTSEENCKKLPKLEEQILIDNDNAKFRTSNNYLTPIASLLSGSVAPNQLNYLTYLEKKYQLHRTKFIFLFGSTISESPSSFIHNEVISKLQENIIYLNFETNSINEVINLINKPYFKGASVTMPFKEQITPHYFNSSDAINTILKIDESEQIIVKNTDTLALHKLMKQMYTIILGTGGAAIAAIEALEKKENILLLGRDINKLNLLKQRYNITTILFDNFHQETKKLEEYQLINCLPPNVNIDRYLNQNCHLIDMSYGLHSVNKKILKNEITGYQILYTQAAYQYLEWFKDSELNFDVILKKYETAMNNFLEQKYFML